MTMKYLARLISFIIVSLLLISCTSNKGNFSLVNKSNESITHASVTICGKKIEFTNIQPGESESGSYDVKSDSHYTIEIEFQSGKKLREETGYVTNGMDFQHVIMVDSSNVEISDSVAKPGGSN